MISESRANEIAMETLNKLCALGIIALDQTSRRLAHGIMAETLIQRLPVCLKTNENASLVDLKSKNDKTYQPGT